MSVQSGLLYEKTIEIYSRRGAEIAKKIIVVCSPDAVPQYPRHFMKFVRVSFHSGDVLVLPHLSPLPEGEGADIVFVNLVPRYSSLVPVIILCALSASAREPVCIFDAICQLQVSRVICE